LSLVSFSCALHLQSYKIGCNGRLKFAESKKESDVLICFSHSHFALLNS
jgi:hypothetical protein